MAKDCPQTISYSFIPLCKVLEFFQFEILLFMLALAERTVGGRFYGADWNARVAQLIKHQGPGIESR